MNLKKDDQDQQNLSSNAISDVDETRRKFNKAGVITPVLLSLSSKPVWAVECGVSGTQSGNLSHQCTNPPTGFNAAQLSSAATWPQPYIKASTTFDSVFGPSSQGSLFGPGVTLLTILSRDVNIALTDAKLRTAFGCTGSTGDLKDALRKYAVQSIVSALNDALFPAYAYPGPRTFYSAITLSPSTPPLSCSNNRIIDKIKGVTTTLSQLRT